jgi:Phage tail lysozyme
LTAGISGNGTSKDDSFRPESDDRPGEPGSQESAKRYTGRHASSRGKAARKRAGKVVPAAAVAAALAAGTAAVFGLVGGGQPQASSADASLALHRVVTSTPGSGIGKANGLGATPIRVATGTASDAARPASKHTAAPAPSRKPAAVPSPTHATATASAPAAPAHAAAAHAAAATTTNSPVATDAATTKTMSCSVSGGMLPDNAAAIVSFLMAHGYSGNAAAGIAGNIYQESKGNPESEGMGGGGLIGWTPLPTGFVTGNVSADLQTQLSALLDFNQGWSQYMPELNAAGSPSEAASIYVTDFERAGIPAASTREASAEAVASACGI